MVIGRVDLKSPAEGILGPAKSAPQRWIQGKKRPDQNTVKYPISIVWDEVASEALEARRLAELHDRWLNPPAWVEWVDEPVPGYPKRPVARDDGAAKALRKRTLTNLYNARPAVACRRSRGP